MNKKTNLAIFFSLILVVSSNGIIYNAEAYIATEPTVSFTLWHTDSTVIQPSANELAHIPPICEIVSPKNQTMLQTNNFTLNVNVATYFWIIGSVYYEADWIEGIHQIFGIQPHGETPLNASITVNFTEIPYGNHTLTVYANTHDNSHSFATVIFSTETPSPDLSKPEPFPMVTVVTISIVTVFMVAAGLMVYLKKHKGMLQTWNKIKPLPQSRNPDLNSVQRSLRISFY